MEEEAALRDWRHQEGNLTAEGLALVLKPQGGEREAVQFVNELKPGESFTVTIHETTSQVEAPCVAIGVAFDGFPVKGELPGWLKNSYGYHGDDGKVFNKKRMGGNGKPFHTPFGQGDTIRCILTNQGSLLFALNAATPLVAIRGIPQKLAVYPTIGANCMVRFSFSTKVAVEEHTGIMMLPNELLSAILLPLVTNPASCIQLSRVCSAWRAVLCSGNNVLWRSYARRRWATVNADLKVRDWHKFVVKRLERERTDKQLIENCELLTSADWEFKCPLSWDSLESVKGESTVKYCKQCKQKVYRVEDHNELLRHVEQNHCVAFLEAKVLANEVAWGGPVHPRSSGPATKKIVVMGGERSGKSTMIIHYTTNHILTDYDPTVEDSYRKRVTFDDDVYMLDILDTAGQIEYRELQDQWIRHGEVFIVAYSITSAKSLEDAQATLERIAMAKADGGGAPIVLVGTKLDLADQREVPAGAGRSLAIKYGAAFKEISCLSFDDVQLVFHGAIKLLNGTTEVMGGIRPTPKKKKGLLKRVLNLGT